MESKNTVSEVGDDIEYACETATVRYGNYILCNDELGLRRLWHIACMTCSPKLLKEPFQWVCEEEGGIVELSFEVLKQIRECIFNGFKQYEQNKNHKEKS